MSNLDKIKARIDAMLALSADKAATEAEAETAMNMAMRLMREYSLSMDDIRNSRVSQSDFVRKSNPGRTALCEIDKFCAMAIGRFCGVRVWAGRADKSGVNFFGYSVDVELAQYIRDLLIRTGEYEWKKYFAYVKEQNTQSVHGRTLRKSFYMGFINRIIERLNAMTAEMADEAKGTGTDLVVIKKQLIDAAFQNQVGIKLQKSYGGTYKKVASAYGAGSEAGDNVRFNRAVRSGGVGGQKLLA